LVNGECNGSANGKMLLAKKGVAVSVGEATFYARAKHCDFPLDVRRVESGRPTRYRSLRRVFH
jgi:hypothetical protein